MKLPLLTPLILMLLCVNGPVVLAQTDDFTFYSESAKQWYEAGETFDWTSTGLTP